MKDEKLWKEILEKIDKITAYVAFMTKNKDRLKEPKSSSHKALNQYLDDIILRLDVIVLSEIMPYPVGFFIELAVG